MLFTGTLPADLIIKDQIVEKVELFPSQCKCLFLVEWIKNWNNQFFIGFFQTSSDKKGEAGIKLDWLSFPIS